MDVIDKEKTKDVLSSRRRRLWDASRSHSGLVGHR